MGIAHNRWGEHSVLIKRFECESLVIRNQFVTVLVSQPCGSIVSLVNNFTRIFPIKVGENSVDGILSDCCKRHNIGYGTLHEIKHPFGSLGAHSDEAGHIYLGEKLSEKFLYHISFFDKFVLLFHYYHCKVLQRHTIQQILNLKV